MITLNDSCVDTYIHEDDKVVILFSGGVDSTVLLFWALSEHLSVCALEFDYYRRPKIEKERSKFLCNLVETDLFSIKYPEVILVSTEKKKNPMFESQLLESNIFYYVLALNFAKANNIPFVLGGQILEDWIDNSIGQTKPKFFERLNMLAFDEFGIGNPKIIMPFHNLSKKEVVNLGKKLSVPFEITWSCLKDQKKPCNSCRACIERNTALKEVNNDK